MNPLLTHLTILALPLIISNVAHMIVVKYNWFNVLKIPISTRLFGANKTWRGVVIVPTLNGLLAVALWWLFNLDYEHPAMLGFLLGLAYVLYELPNSFLKRKLGIAPGERPKKRKFLFIFLDKADSPTGVISVYFLMGFLHLKYCLLLLLAGIAIHISISYLLVITKLKTSL